MANEVSVPAHPNDGVQPQAENASQPMIDAKLTEKLNDAKLSAYKDEYATHVRIWADLERKAQAMTAIAGTFVAAANALAASGDLRGPGLGPVTALVGVLLLGMCAMRSIQALSVRTVLITSADEIVRTIDTGIRVGADFQTIVNTQLSPWRRVIAEVERANRDKAKHLHDAEVLLACAVFVFTLLAMVRFALLFSPR
jgi:hypothetical protein